MSPTEFLGMVKLSLITMLTLVSCITVDENGGYKGITVAISTNVKPDNVESLIQNIHTLFNMTSGDLHQATGKKLFFKYINILLPSNWHEETYEKLKLHYDMSEDDLHNFEDADVRVDDANPMHGDHPYTLQIRGCGHPGPYIHLTPAFIMNRQNPEISSKSLLHQWAHLRFGIFDEIGYAGDKLYPPFYTNTAEIPIPTSCSNIPVKGDVISQFKNESCNLVDLQLLLNSTCSFEASKTNNDYVESSLMYLYDLPNVTSFCGWKNFRHTIEAPSMQNFLCSYKSTWRVIESSGDYNSVVHGIEEVEATQIQLIKRTDKLRFILAVDVSHKRREHSRVEVTRLALEQAKKTITDFEDQDMKIITYSESAKVASHGIGDLSSLSSSNKTCVKCALQKAAQISNTTGIRNLILIADAAADVEIMSRNNQKIFLILYPMAQNITKWKNLADKVFAIKEDGYFATFEKLERAFLSIFNAIRPAKQPRLDLKVTTSKPNETVGKIQVTTSSSTVDAYFITLELPNITIITTEGRHSRLSDFIGRLPFYMSQVYLDRNITYEINNRNFLYAMCSVIPDELSMNHWTNIDNGMSIAAKEPLSIYAKISSNYQPVLSANVNADIEEHIDGNHVITSSIKLSDDGNTDSDITANDGVYGSHYMRSVDAGTVFSISIRIEGTEATTIGKNRSWVHRRCCGSAIRISDEDKLSISSYQLNLGSLFVNYDIQSRNFPPSRIIDLEVAKMTPKYFTLKWTAPGGFLHVGKAESYRMGFTMNRTQLLVNDSIWISLGHEPSAGGQQESFTVQQTATNGIFYCAIRARNGNNIQSLISNVVRVMLKQSLETRTTETELSTTEIETANSSSSSSSLVPTPPSESEGKIHLTSKQVTLIICLSFLVLLIVIIIIGIFCFCKFRMKKTDEEIVDEELNPGINRKLGVSNMGFQDAPYARPFRRSSMQMRNAATQTGAFAAPTLHSVRNNISDLYAKPIPKNQQTVTNSPQNNESHHMSSYF